jgi:hypothetical protein
LQMAVFAASGLSACPQHLSAHLATQVVLTEI